MTTTYTTKDGDTADAIAWRYYGETATRPVEQLLEANPGLAAYGPRLPAGLVITLPEIETTAKDHGIRLWD